MIISKAIFIVLFLFIEFVAFSQEILEPLISNPELEGQPVSAAHLKSASTKSLLLPFFDDFSNIKNIRPSDSLWNGNTVYVNAQYGKMPVSIGVASFDALDENGVLYANKSKSLFRADSLTSKPINLNYPGDKSIYLSFYYQPGGFGEIPEVSDSLFLQFWAPSQKKWHNVLKIPGISSASSPARNVFKLAMINVIDTAYLQDGFKFQFYNYASLIVANTPAGKNGNNDIWNIDYVYMNINRDLTDTIMRDAAIVYPIKSLLMEYESMPWRHFKADFMSSKTSLIVKNNNAFSSSIYQKYNIVETQSGEYYLNPPDNRRTLNEFQTDTLTSDIDSYIAGVSYPERIQDGADFRIKISLETDDDNSKKVNDTTEYHQIFSNYYAYDDGTSEIGYGIGGENAEGALIAYKFKLENPDSLQAITIFFNERIPSKLDADFDKRFTFCVWKDNGGVPDTAAIYREVVGEYPQGAAHWETIRLKKAIYLTSIFYIGIEQKSAYFPNIGYDVNRVSNDKLFFSTGPYIMPDGKTSGFWDKSKASSGALMIRPYVGKYSDVFNSARKISTTKFDIYPNPSSSFINIQSNTIPDKAKIEIIDLTGKLVLVGQYSGRQIDIRNLSNGLYLIRIQAANGAVFNSKFIKR